MQLQAGTLDRKPALQVNILLLHLLVSSDVFEFYFLFFLVFLDILK